LSGGAVPRSMADAKTAGFLVVVWFRPTIGEQI
jgi:hypothetical protein